MKRALLSAAVIAAVSFVMPLLAPAQPADQTMIGRPAPQFTLSDFDGKYVSLADYKGKIVVLEWFNDECPFVKYHYRKATTMLDLAKKYKDKNVVWLAINSTSHTTPRQNLDFAEKHNLTYPILDDRSGAVARAYGARSTPHIFIIDAKGNIAYNGAIDSAPMGKTEGEIVNYVDNALAELTGGEALNTPVTKPYGCTVKYRKAHPFNLKSHDDKQIKLSNYAGKIVVLEWFNYECPFVKHHYEQSKTMANLAEKYKDKNVIWLAVNSTAHATADQTRGFAEQHSLPYPVLGDHSGAVGRAYHAKTTPHIYIINTEGNIVYTGAIDNAPLGKTEGAVVGYVDKALAELTAGQPVSIPATKPYGCSVKYAPKQPKPAPGSESKPAPGRPDR